MKRVIDFFKWIVYGTARPLIETKTPNPTIRQGLEKLLLELDKECKYTHESVNDQFPSEKGLKSISEAYNRACNSQRLIFKQKLQRLLRD